jgi:hypothetical protein
VPPTQSPLPDLFTAVAAYSAALHGHDQLAKDRVRVALDKCLDRFVAQPLLDQAARAATPVLRVLRLALGCACNRLASLVIALYVEHDGVDTDTSLDRHAVPLSVQIRHLVTDISDLEQEIEECEQRARRRRRLRP